MPRTQKLRQCTSRQAFTVQIRLKKDEPKLGPDGLVTRILEALSSGARGQREWIFPLGQHSRDRLITFVFFESDRKKISRRFHEIGITVPKRSTP